MAHREQYSDAPLVYVACELQYPLVPRANRDETFEVLTEAFTADLPFPVKEERALLVSPTESMNHQKLFRFVSRDRSWSVSVTQSAVTVETTDYPGWEVFLGRIVTSLNTIRGVLTVAGVSRVGLRYVNEIRVDAPVDNVADWGRWVSPALVTPVSAVPVGVTGAFQAVVQSRPVTGASGTELPDDAGPALTVRYGALEGEGVVSDGPLRKVRQRGSGQFFVIDMDSFETPADFPAFDGDVLGPFLERLHEPLDNVFESMISDQLRSQFRKGN